MVPEMDLRAGANRTWVAMSCNFTRDWREGLILKNICQLVPNLQARNEYF